MAASHPSSRGHVAVRERNDPLVGREAAGTEGPMWRTLSICTLLVLLAGHGRSHAQAPALQVPACRVDPAWPRVPDGWIFGAMAGIATDSKDNVWVIHRGGSVTMNKACCKPGPAVMQFDPSGR